MQKQTTCDSLYLHNQIETNFPDVHPYKSTICQSLMQLANSAGNLSPKYMQSIKLKKNF